MEIIKRKAYFIHLILALLYVIFVVMCVINVELSNLT